MGIIFMDGFERRSTNAYASSSGVSFSSGISNMSGDYCLNATSISSYIKYYLSSSLTELYMMYRVMVTSSNNIGLAIFYDSNNAVIAMVRSDNLIIKFYRGTGTLLASGPTISLNTTYLIKMYYKPMDSGGVFKLWVDGVLGIDYSGDTTNGIGNCKSILFGYLSGISNGYLYMDDLIISTTDITKNLRIAGKAVTGAGSNADWTPSSGSNNWDTVEEIPPSDSDYNYTNTIGHVDTFNIANCTESIASIEALQVNFNCAYEGTPTPSGIQSVLRHGGTDYASGTTILLPSSFGHRFQVYETNPGTGSAFTESDINNLEVGYESVS